MSISSKRRHRPRTKRGLFIDIEGTDGSGKATQAKLLARTLQQQGRVVHTIAFPQYGKHSAAPIQAYLNGEYGSLGEVGPYRASIFYAIDRLTARTKIMQWLKQGHIVLADRYMASNLAFQGAKIPSWNARKKYWMWDEEFEYELLNIPRPDMTLVLMVPPSMSDERVLKKKLRPYIKRRKRDIHERDLKYQRRVVGIYQELATFDRSMQIINCAPHGIALSIPQVHELLMQILGKRIRG